MSGSDSLMFIIFLLLLSVFNTTMFHWLGQNPGFYQLNAYTWESDDFRSMKLGAAVAGQDYVDYDQITSLMLEHEFDLTDCRDLTYHNSMALIQKPAAYKKLCGAYEVILKDLKYFPVPESTRAGTPFPVYEDSWKQKRTYGGERGHEGCDIMGTERERGFYPVISISDGTVEKIGWLEQGGWRIGIRTESGAYLYYAPLYSYAPDLKQGDKVKAGSLLGYMGDSGYGKQENTVGNFAVHLHLGIYIRTDHYEELSVNPYWILKYLEKYKLKYNY